MSDGNPILPPVPNLDGKDVRANWNATALAFLGDSVWEVCRSTVCCLIAQHSKHCAACIKVFLETPQLAAELRLCTALCATTLLLPTQPPDRIL